MNIENQLNDQLMRQICTTIDVQVGFASTQYDQLYDQLKDPLWGQLVAQLNDQLYDQLKEEIDCV